MTTHAIAPRGATETDLLDLVSAGQRLGGLSHWTLRAWAAAGKIATVKVGSRVLVPLGEIERIIAAGYRPRRVAE